MLFQLFQISAPIGAGAGLGVAVGQGPARAWGGRLAGQVGARVGSASGCPKRPSARFSVLITSQSLGIWETPMIKQHRIAIVGAGLVGGSAALFAAYSILALKSF